MKKRFQEFCSRYFSSSLNSRDLKNLAIFIGTKIFTAFIPFALVPVITRYLNPSGYGTFTIYQTLGSFALPFIGMGMTNYINKNYFSKSRDEMGVIIFNLTAMAFLNASLIAVLIFWGTFFQNALFGIPVSWLITLPVLTFLSVLHQFSWMLLRNQNKAGTFAAVEISTTVLSLCLSVLFVTVFLWDWQGRAGAYLLSTAFAGIFSMILIYRSGFFIPRLDRRIIAEAWAFCAPMVLHGIGYVIICLSDNLFIDKMLGKNAVGIYSIGYFFGLFIYMITEAFNNLWAPWMYQQLAAMTAANKIMIVRATYFYQAVVIGLALASSWAAGHLLVLLTPPAYHGAKDLIIWVSLAYTAEGLHNMLYPYIVHEGKTRFLGVNNIAACLTNLAANYYLIKWNGIVGGAQATFLSFLWMYLTTWWYANRVYPMPWFSFFKKNKDAAL